ncbi:MAG: tRNA (guanosine(37)-N1)-methyltransferase TrmD [Elusimicrobia bacterium]|nr:tRNA (guanosine(37)-N1)-methyltransferase TrmD [Elusimicrobiota bacterium]
MRIDILTIFPGMFEGPLTESLIKKAREKKILDIRLHDIRSFTTDKHRSVDDRSFGGGSGMVMSPEPIFRAIKSLKIGSKASRKKSGSLLIYLSPQGEPLNQKLVNELSGKKRLVLLCGHYEGIDERAISLADKEISIGDYVLTGGELPAMVLIDAVARHLPGVVKEKNSVERDSFYNGLLDYPHYTRPKEFQKMKVPETLLSGNHKEIEKWRKKQSLEKTFLKRPDLLKKIKLNKEEIEILNKIKKSAPSIGARPRPKGGEQ